MHNHVSVRWLPQRLHLRSTFKSLGQLLLLAFGLLILTGCFQSAGDGLIPTTVDLTALASLSAPTLTPFVTPLPPQGFTPPTLSSAVTPTDPSNVPATDIPPTGPAMTEVSVTSPADLPTTIPATPNDTAPTVLAPGVTPAANPTDNPAGSPSAPTQVPAVGITPLATDGSCTHIVQPNEWLYKIAQEYKIDAAQLVAANPQAVNRILQPGDIINLPNCTKTNNGTPTAAPNNTASSSTTAPTAAGPTSTPTATEIPPVFIDTFTPTFNGPAPTPIPLSNNMYTVASGDTLGGIAHKFNITVEALKSANQLTSDFLRIGQQLKIPQAGQN